MHSIPSCSNTSVDLESIIYMDLDDDITLFALENGSYLNLNINSNLSVGNVKTKVLEFSKFLNSTGRLTLPKCDKSESEELVFLFLTLKKNIKCCLTELARSRAKQKYLFTCCECDEVIVIESKQNFWESLQQHEHFEELYYKFLNGSLNILAENMDIITEDSNNSTAYNEDVPITHNVEISYNENTDSGIDNENFCEPDQNESAIELPASPEVENPSNGEDNVNNFRFNFEVHYDSVVEHKIYPDGLMKAIRKIDRVKDYTIQKAGLFRAVCLLCSCDLVSRSKVSKTNILDHSIGARHLRFAASSESLTALKKYHEIWLNLEPCYQAHQVYFRPDISPSFKCILCNLLVNHKNLITHIETDPHKKKVLETFDKKSNIFFLTDLQVQVYGVVKEQVEIKEREVKEREPVKAVVKTKKRTVKTDSDSSPSSDSKEFKHNIIKSVKDATSSNLLDLIPNRYRGHLKFLKNDTNEISCEVCKVTFDKNINTIKKHIRQANHVKISKLNPKKYNYYCEICNVKMLDENSWEKHFTDGPNKHASMAESRKDKTSEYECTKCCTVIYGDDLSLTRHLSVNSRREKKSKEVKLPEAVKKMFRTIEVLEGDAQKLTLEANDTLMYNQLTMDCCAKLESTLSAVFEGCKAYPFGSRISGLGNKYSDLDVFIDTGDMYTGYRNQDPVAQVQLVRKAVSVLSKHRDKYQDVVPIPTARTPIVKLYHKQTEIECDLSFRHGLSVENTKFLRFCLDLQPITQPFILTLKKWSEHNNLTEHITTYALAIMAIFYLQVNKHLLSVKELRQLNPKESLVINGWETINYTMPLEEMKRHVEPYPHTVSVLLRDFFGYYTKFGYNFDVICPLLGRTLQKKQFYEGSNCEMLPDEMKSYVAQLHSEEPEQFKAMSPFCIQDPFDLSHNLTKACQIGTLNKFKTLCDLSFKHLDSIK